MLYGLNPSYNSPSHSFISMGMCRCKHAVIFCSTHYGCQFICRKLWVLTIFSHTEHPSCRCNFNDVCSIFITLSHCFSGICRGVHHSFSRAWVSHEIVASSVSWVCMTSCSTYRLTCSKNPRPHYSSFGNGFSQGYIYPTTP